MKREFEGKTLLQQSCLLNSELCKAKRDIKKSAKRKQNLRRSFAPAKPPTQHVASEREAQARLPSDKAKKNARSASEAAPRDSAKKSTRSASEAAPRDSAKKSARSASEAAQRDSAKKKRAKRKQNLLQLPFNFFDKKNGNVLRRFRFSGRGKLFPLDCARGFGGDVVNDTVDSIDFFDDAAHHGIEKFPGKVDDLRCDRIHTVDRADSDNIIV